MTIRKDTQQRIQANTTEKACKRKICPVCGAAFDGTARQKYCGTQCRTKGIYQAQKQRKRAAEAEIDAQKVAAWKAEKEKHRGRHLCYCVMCFKQFYSDSPHTLYCSPACMRIYGGKSMTWRSTQK